MNKQEYGLVILDHDGNILLGENENRPLETMSSIKSIIGSTAIDLASSRNDDIRNYIVSITKDHNSNGSGILKYALARQERVRLTLADILRHNILESNCVATNMLIDYVGGQDEVNRRFSSQFERDDIHLAAERLNFTDLNHDSPQPQVGVATAYGLAEYYRCLWSRPLSAAHAWHRHLHGQIQTTSLFNLDYIDIPPPIQWLHKSGSGDDVDDDRLHSVLADAGQLNKPDNTYYSAAGLTVSHRGDGMPSRRQIRQYFASRNIVNLALAGIELQIPPRQLEDVNPLIARPVPV